MQRFTVKVLAVAGALTTMGLISGGCAISDYRGYLGHQTQSEAKLAFDEIAFLGFDPNQDGTYAYTVKYDFRGTTTQPAVTYPDEIVIISYRNPVFAAFSRDGCVDRDGDDVQQRGGNLAGCDNPVPAGKFAPKWRFGDSQVGCQFYANYEQTFGSPKDIPGVTLCFTQAQEEYDKDLDLQAESFANLDDFFNRLWSGALGTSFVTSVTNVTFNGTTVNLDAPLALNIGTSSLRPRTLSVDFSSPGGQALIRAILANTTNRASVRVSFGFDGGMRVSIPALMTVAFNHDALTKALK